MDNALVINFDHHRSRERIKGLGEVFTPEQYVNQMLSLFDQKIWSDENTVFFEPTAGHGNILIPILVKRTECLLKKYRKAQEREPELCALATSLNTIWAIDICPQNVELAKKRIFSFTINYLLTHKIKLAGESIESYLAHVLCTLNWQIQDNEALSALATQATSNQQANRTKLGAAWLKKNQHKPLDFRKDWCTYYQSQIASKTVPLQFERAHRFISAILRDERLRSYSEFTFAKSIFEIVEKVDSQEEPRAA